MRKLLLLAILCIGIYLAYSYYGQGDTHTQPHLSTSERAPRTAPRINQLDPAQYNSQKDYNDYAYSACSTAAMTSVMNYYGRQYRVADVLKVEVGLHEITPDLGLVEPDGIAHTVAQFGFSARRLSQSTLPEELQQVETIANGGHPIIVSFPPETYAGGHIFIVDGSGRYALNGNGPIVPHLIITDSARFNWRFMPEENFLKYWRGFAVEVYPKGTQP